MVEYNIFYKENTNKNNRMKIKKFLEIAKDGYYFDPKEHKIHKILDVQGVMKRTRYHCVVKTKEKNFKVTVDMFRSLDTRSGKYVPLLYDSDYTPKVYIFKNIEDIAEYLKLKYQNDIRLLNKYKKQYESKVKKLELFNKLGEEYPEFLI